MDELDIYSVDNTQAALEDDELSMEEALFLEGYDAAYT